MIRAERYRRTQRLRGGSVSEILALARPRRAGAVSVRVKANGLNYSRLGLVVSKRCLPRAVDRNRAKRLLREWFRRNQEYFVGQDLLVRLDTRRSPVTSVIDDLKRALVLER